MLNHPTLSKLQTLQFHGIARAFAEQLDSTDIGELDFEARFALLVDREWTERRSRQLTNRLRRAKAPPPRRLPGGRQLPPPPRPRQGPHRLARLLPVAARAPQRAHYRADRRRQILARLRARPPGLPHLFAELDISRGDGRYPKLLASLAKTEVLILDDWGLGPMTPAQRRDLLEIIEERHTRRSTLATSQLPVDKWHDLIGDPTLADAILDRLVHSAYKFNLKGESMRKRHQPLTQTEHPSA